MEAGVKIRLTQALLVCVLLIHDATAAQPANVVGWWKLVAVTSTTPDGKRTTPFGAQPSGSLHYSADGRMTLMISYDGRPKLSGTDRVAAPAAERAEAFATFISYAGRYTISGGEIRHHIELCSYQNWVGTDQVRNLRVDGRRLSLTTPPLSINGATQSNELVWERVD
jgi:hypothetical protein